jgi:hypothetical protein
MAHICLLQSIINVAQILMLTGNLSLLQLAVIMSMENAAQGHNTLEEGEGIMNNWQLDDPGSYHNPEDELGHLLEKRVAWKGSDDRDPDDIPEQQEVWLSLSVSPFL